LKGENVSWNARQTRRLATVQRAHEAHERLLWQLYLEVRREKEQSQGGEKNKQEDEV